MLIHEQACKFARDITLRKQIEKELGESENYVTALLATMPAGVVVFDSETQRITDANSFALVLLGRERGQVVGQMRDEFFCSAEAASGRFRERDRKGEYSGHFLLRADGSRLPILKNVLPLIRQGRTYLVEAFGDLTDLKRTKSDLQKAKVGGIGGVVAEFPAQLPDEHQPFGLALRLRGHCGFP